MKHLAILLAAAAPAAAQDAPVVDTEDASLGSAAVGPGRLHPLLTIDVRNGDLARGGYDDDPADLDRLPVHVQFGAALELGRDASGRPHAWLLALSSNGLHAPSAAERSGPRGWYESNNLAALVVEPARGLRTGVAYTVKASPNGVSATTHELSVDAAWEAERGPGVLRPGFAATWRPRGGGGFYT